MRVLTGHGRFRLEAPARKIGQWSYEYRATMLPVHPETGGPLEAAKERQVSPRDIVAPWADYREEYERQAAASAERKRQLAENGELIRASLERLGFARDQVGVGDYGFSRLQPHAPTMSWRCWRALTRTSG